MRDVNGKVMGFCGWDYETIVCKIFRFSYLWLFCQKRNIIWYGRVKEYYRSNKPVFVVEGIVCALYLRSKGFHALALLGLSI